MVREWLKVLSQGTSSHQHLHDPAFVKEFLRGAAMCEAALGEGVPVLWAYAEAILRATDDVGRVRMFPHMDYEAFGLDVWNLTRGQPSPVHSAARESFCRAFGVTPEDQILYEGILLDDVHLPIEGARRECSTVGPVEAEREEDRFVCPG